MSKIKPGNKLNSWLNGEWATHVRGYAKRWTSKRRRIQGKKVTFDELRELSKY